MDIEEKYYRVKEVAEKLDLSIETIRRYIRSGKLEACHFSKGYYITKEQINKFLEGKGERG